MHNKKYMIRFSRLIYHLKSLGKLKLVPLIIIYILTPFMCYLNCRADLNVDKEAALRSFQIQFITMEQSFLFFFSVWWIIFILRDYIEADGNELLYVNKSRNKMIDLLYPYIFYLANVFILCTIVSLINGDLRYEFIRIVSISIFYVGMTYMVVYLTRSITITLMVNLVYTLVNISKEGADIIFPYYYDVNNKPLTYGAYMSVCLPLLIVGIFMLIVGTILNKKMLKFV